MYRVGGNEGKTFVSPEGDGMSSYIGFPKTENMAMWKLERDEKNRLKKEQDEKQERLKTMGVLDSFKPDWFYVHDKDLNKEVGGFINKVSQAMVGKPNPFDPTTPEGNQLLKEKDRIQGLIGISKNQRELYDKYSQIDKKNFDPKSLEEYDKFLASNLTDLADGKIKLPVLRPKNPYESELAVWSTPEFKNAENEAQQRGVDLADEPALKLLISDKLNADPNVQSFYQSKFDNLSPKEKQAYVDKARQMTISEGRQINPFEAMASDFLQSTLLRKPFDYEDFLKKLEVGDVTNAGGNQSGTWESKNTGKKFESNLNQVADSALKGNDKLLNSIAKKYNITEKDPDKRYKAILSQVKKDKKARMDISSRSTEYKLSDGEKGKEELASTGDLWLNNLYSGDKTLESDAAGFIFGKNTVFGDNVRNVEIKRSMNNLQLPNPYIFIKYDNDTEAARAAKLMTEQGIDNLDEAQKAQIGAAFTNEVAIPLTEENKQRLKGVYEGSAIARKQIYKPVAKKVEGKLNNIGKAQSVTPKNKYDF